MKLFSQLVMLTAIGLAATSLQAAESDQVLTGCAAKKADIQQQIDKSINPFEKAGLEKALSEVNEHCTDAGLKKEREQKVLDARHEVTQRTKDLDKAMKKGDAEKINKRKDKLAESKKELQEALDALDR
jgi:paraquat-inducible protein B